MKSIRYLSMSVNVFKEDEIDSNKYRNIKKS